MHLETGRPVRFDGKEQHFQSSYNSQLLPTLLKLPLSATLQVTRRCNLRCVYCSEDSMIKEPTTEFLHQLIDSLSGLQRIIIAGGEPTLREDLPEIAKHLSQRVGVVAMASNSVLVSEDLAMQLKPSLSYVDVTIDGSRDTHNRIRGNYDKVIDGIKNFVSANIDVSLVTVLLKENADDLLQVCRLADELGARKLKVLTPIKKGRGQHVLSKTVESSHMLDLYHHVRDAKREAGWNVRITFTDWNRVSEGHAILVHPDGDVVASPVPTNVGCIRKLGNLGLDSVESIWETYPYKDAHVRKYLEESLYVC